MAFVRAFASDETYDHAHASNGRSRYGVYLASRAALFADQHQQDDRERHGEHDGPLGRTSDRRWFAAAAWRIATAPVMSPPYIRAHGRVQSTTIRWDDDGRAAVLVELAVSASAEAACLAHPWRRWTRDDQGRWVAPTDYLRPNAVTLLRVAVPLSVMSLPRPCYEDGNPDTLTAKRAVQAIAATLNAALVHVLMFDPDSAEGSARATP